MDATRPTYTFQQFIISSHSEIQFNLFNINFKPIKFNNFMQKNAFSNYCMPDNSTAILCHGIMEYNNFHRLNVV